MANIFTWSEIRHLYNSLQFELVYRDNRVLYINGLLYERMALTELVNDLRKDIGMLEETTDIIGANQLVKEYKSIITRFAVHFGISGKTPYH